MDGQAEDIWHLNHILSFKDFFKKLEKKKTCVCVFLNYHVINSNTVQMY